MTTPRRAVLASLVPEGDPALLELEALLGNLGYEVAGTVFQKRAAPDPSGFLGQGKAEEIRLFAQAQGARILVVEGELSPLPSGASWERGRSWRSGTAPT